MWCECVYVCLHVWTYVYTCIFRPEVDIRFLSHSTLFFLKKKLNQGRVSWWTQNFPLSSGLFSQLSLGNSCVFLWQLFVLAGNLSHSSLQACLCDKKFCNFFLWQSGHFNILLHQTRTFKQLYTYHLEWTNLNILLLCLKYLFSFFLLFFFQVKLLINVDSSWVTFSVVLKAYIPK